MAISEDARLFGVLPTLGAEPRARLVCLVDAIQHIRHRVRAVAGTMRATRVSALTESRCAIDLLKNLGIAHAAPCMLARLSSAVVPALAASRA